ncbi:hypothetical protein KTS45_18280 [Halomicroarcula limicola]|uniref:Uncharacterized protein n=1 Tax=Haloarcula limicola TaxID=1429915 RepID=A0A8J8C8K1_9EURY|nr:hypothetical protein [Halomicroarcula limicola]MBV0926158.1 hypothetical protein [Halomicroarcula limicola]
MSTASSSLPRPPAIITVVQSAAVTAIEALVTTVRGLAFWAAILLPIVISATLLAGVVASSPHFVGSLFVLNVVCAVFGQNYSPGR